MPRKLPVAPAISHLKVVSHDNSNFRSLSGRIGQSSPRNAVARACVCMCVCLIAVPLGIFHRSRNCYRICGQQSSCFGDPTAVSELRVQLPRYSPSRDVPSPPPNHALFFAFQMQSHTHKSHIPCANRTSLPSCIFPIAVRISHPHLPKQSLSACVPTAIVRFRSIQLPLLASLITPHT
jgi:hypothetical protein